jgi:DNA replication licensing factor MCM7
MVNPADIQFDDDTALLHNILRNTRRYLQLFSEVVDQLMPAPDRALDATDDVLDVIMAQRRERNAQHQQTAETAGDQELFPPELMRRYNVYFRPPRNSVPLAVRSVKGGHLGKLITVRGIVTRVSEVKPLLLVNAYTCESCGNEIFQEIAQKAFTPLAQCPSQQCKLNNSKGQLHMQTRASRFRPFQEVKIQEMVSALRPSKY